MAHNIDSILSSIKKLLMLSDEDTSFDTDVIIHINSVISILDQLGVPSASGFSVTGDSETWSDLIGDHPELEAVRSYVYLKVRMLFDPPTSNAVLESMTRVCGELEWRIYATAEAMRRNVQSTS